VPRHWPPMLNLVDPDKNCALSKEAKMYPPFTPFFDWIAQQKDLTLLEKLIICKVLRYGKKGCYESYRSMSRNFGVDHSNLTKAVKGLIAKDWLCVLYESKYRRIFYVIPERLSAGPLFDLPGVNIPHAVGQSGGNIPHVVENVSSDNKREKKHIISSCAELMRDEAEPLSKREKEQRRQQFLTDCERMRLEALGLSAGPYKKAGVGLRSK